VQLNVFIGKKLKLLHRDTETLIIQNIRKTEAQFMVVYQEVTQD